VKTSRIQQLVREPIAVVAYDRDGPNCDPQKITPSRLQVGNRDEDNQSSAIEGAAAIELRLHGTPPLRELGQRLLASNFQVALAFTDARGNPVGDFARNLNLCHHSPEQVRQENIADSPRVHARIIDTLKHSNAISVGASIDRTAAALGAGVLERWSTQPCPPRPQTPSRRCSVTRQKTTFTSIQRAVDFN